MSPTSAALKLPHPQEDAPDIWSGEDLEPRFVAADDWDAIVVQFKDCVHEQAECFNGQRWGADQLERIAFYRGDQLVAAAQLMLMPIPLFKTGMAVCKWGPLWRRKGEVDDLANLLNFKAALQSLQRIYAKERGWFLSIFPHADPDFVEEEEQSYRICGFEAGESLTSPNRYFVNCQIDEEELRASLVQKWRYNLKKAGKKGMTTRIATGEEGFATFMTLYEEMLARKGFHDSSGIDTLKGLLESDQSDLWPMIMLVEKDGEALAGGVIDMSGDRAIYLFGATSNKSLPMNAGYILNWAVAGELVRNPDIDWYDLGGADLESDLHQFKRGFIGKRGKIIVTPPYYHYAASRRVMVLGKLLYFARRTKGKLEYDLHGLIQSLRRHVGLG
jgi:lipid II:glycine glycyltransferase (peptidoglycan interpeptide bridge formation enzyme)